MIFHAYINFDLEKMMRPISMNTRAYQIDLHVSDFLANFQKVVDRYKKQCSNFLFQNFDFLRPFSPLPF